MHSHSPSPPDPNPYAPPLGMEPLAKPLLPQELWPQLDLRVAQVQKSAMRRTIVLDGNVSAEVYYDGWAPQEVVWVNRRQKFRGGIEIFAIVNPRIDFELEGESFRVPARIDVKARLSLLTLVRIREFRLTVAGRVVYQE